MPTSSMIELEQFRSLVLASPSMQKTLQRMEDVSEFVDGVVGIGRGVGFSFSADDVANVMGANGLPTIARSLIPTDGSRLGQDWIPFRASWSDRELHLGWAWFGDVRRRDPFFEQSVRHCWSGPFNRLFACSTAIDAAADWMTRHSTLAPDGFIFHMSRCGSTLVSQMLAAVPGNIVVSEASPIDAVTTARFFRPDVSEDRQAAWLRSIVGALGQRRRREERHYFVKLDFRHAMALPLFRRAFPDVPWVFLYREPIEVLVSQVRMRAAQLMPMQSRFIGIELADALRMSAHDYSARVLAAICDAALRHHDKRTTLLVNYRQLPGAVFVDILPHFGISLGEAERVAMMEAARYHAKSPGELFTADAEAKQQAATGTIRAAAAGRLAEAYRRLEALRLGPEADIV
jgi:hypothetical protein